MLHAERRAGKRIGEPIYAFPHFSVVHDLPYGVATSFESTPLGIDDKPYDLGPATGERVEHNQVIERGDSRSPSSLVVMKPVKEEKPRLERTTTLTVLYNLLKGGAATPINTWLSNQNTLSGP